MFVGDATKASAFWPFFSTAQADTSGVIPSSNTPTLAAATNYNPNPDQGSTGPTLSTGDSLMANQGPDGVPSGDSIVNPASAQISTYIVKPGDTLSEIAQSYGVSINTIVWANSLGSSKAIHPGQTLVILPVSGVEHTVVKGDTLASIARKYGGDKTDIADYNGLDSSAGLVVGTDIIIPNGEISAATVAATKPSGGKKTGGKIGSSGSSKNPYRGGAGPEIDGYYENPVPGALLTQGLHGENAVDLAIARGTPVEAAADGTVIVAKNNGAWNGGYGNYVVIAHANGTQTLYSHMVTGSVLVSIGDTVSQGQVIAKVGMTGDATGPHVHFEVRGAMNPFGGCSLNTHTSLFGCN